MVKTKRRSQKSVLETFWFTIDDWCREYRFGINRHRWEFDPDHHSERDEIKIAGRLRTKTKLRIDCGEAHILPSYLPRKEFGEDADRIGNAWVKKGRLFCSAFIPADAYYSLPPSLAAGKFVEMTIRVRDLHRGRGNADAVSLDNEPMEIDAEERASTLGEAVRVAQWV